MPAAVNAEGVATTVAGSRRQTPAPRQTPSGIFVLLDGLDLVAKRLCPIAIHRRYAQPTHASTSARPRKSVSSDGSGGCLGFGSDVEASRLPVVSDPQTCGSSSIARPRSLRLTPYGLMRNVGSTPTPIVAPSVMRLNRLGSTKVYVRQ